MYICPNCGATGPLEKAAAHLRRCCTKRVNGVARKRTQAAARRECCGQSFIGDDAGMIIHMAQHATTQES